MARLHFVLKSMTLAAPALMLASTAHAQSDGGDEFAGLIVVLLILAALYLIPTIVAFSRGHPNRWPILVINIVFGGTGLGWLGSLVWACSAVHRSPTGNHGGESGLNLFANDPVMMRIDGPVNIATPERDPADELVRLKHLLDAGAIDEDEYRRLRAGPLDRLAGRRP